jgi:NAD(P)-dependent dehydrogenase (short-subunit alcohol dehydrogenase family)
MQDMGVFTGKVAFVTGATSGIGRATALAFAQAGASVIAAGRRAPEGEAVLALLRREGDDALFVKLDVTEEAAVAAAIETVLSHFGRLDYGVNCAAIDAVAQLTDCTAAEYHRVFDTNVKGLVLCLRHEILAMRQGGGAIVNIGSLSAEKAVAGQGLYSASKSAVRMLTHTAALEEAVHGIRSNELAPGPIYTPMLHGFLGQAAGAGWTVDRVREMSPLRQIGTPEDVANAVLFLCSPQAAYITGACLAVDGGFRLI